jgi:hypothetical protein
MLLQKMRALLFLLYIGLALTACDSFTTESEGEILEDADIDIISPSIRDSSPDADVPDFEVDSKVKVTFSELMNIEILDKPFTKELEVDGETVNQSFSSGVVLYSGEAEGDAEFQLSDERPRLMKYSVELGEDTDLITNNLRDIDVTAFTLQHESGRFALNTIYTVFISEHVIDLADDLKTENTIEGNALGRDIQLTFQTEDGEWENDIALAFRRNGSSESETELLEGDQFEPHLTSNKVGDVLAVWRQNNSGGSNDTMGIWASRYSPNDERWVLSNTASSESAGIESAERIDSAGLVTNAFGPKITINDSGKAVATWYQAPDGSSESSIWVNIFDFNVDTNDYRWGVAETISTNLPEFEASFPEIGIDDDGNILATWLEVDNGIKFLKSTYYNTSTNTWFDEPLVLNNTFSGDARQPTLSFTADGVAMVAWSQEESGKFNIYVSSFLGSSWSEPLKLNSTLIPEARNGSASKPKIAIDNNSDAFVIWQQRDSDFESILSSRFSGSVWSDPFEMEITNQGDALDPFIAIGTNNQAFAIWVQPEGVEPNLKRSVVTRYYSQDTGWESVIEPLSVGDDISNPIVQFDYEGNAVASWIFNGRVERVRYSKLISDWLGAETNSFNANNSQSINLVPLVQDGRFINVWAEFKNGSFKLFSALFTD